MRLDDSAALAHWKASCDRAKYLQAGLAVAAFFAGATLAARTVDGLLSGIGGIYLTATLLMLANWPWTFLVMRTTNGALLATAPELAGERTRELLGRWNRLHAARTVFGAAATGLILLVGILAMADVAA